MNKYTINEDQANEILSKLGNMPYIYSATIIELFRGSLVKVEETKPEKVEEAIPTIVPETKSE